VGRDRDGDAWHRAAYTHLRHWRGRRHMARRRRRAAFRAVLCGIHLRLQVCGAARQPAGDSRDSVRGTRHHPHLAGRCRPDPCSPEHAELATVRNTGCAWCGIVVYSLYRRTETYHAGRGLNSGNGRAGHRVAIRRRSFK